MSQERSLRFLGTGGSMGIPIVGCSCAVCHSKDPKNERLRPSALLTLGEKRILIDAGPDFRTQALKHQINTLDGVMFTHAHHDHTAGVDDLRVYYLWQRRPLPVWMSQETADDLCARYAYIFTDKHPEYKLVSKLEVNLLEGERGEVNWFGEGVPYFTFKQGGMSVNGFRIGTFAFVSDIKEYPESLFKDLEGVQTLVLSALRDEASPLHFSIDDAIAFSRKVGTQQTWLTHIAHELEHEAADNALPEGVALAYDGLVIPLS